MYASRIVAAFALLFASVASSGLRAQAGRAAGAAVSGSLRYQGAGEPAVLRRVLLCRVGEGVGGRLTQSVRWSVETDASGNFQFLDVPPGVYAVVSALSELLDSGGRPMRVRIASAGERQSLGVFTVARGAVVAGRLVRDNAAGPLPNVQLMLTQITEAAQETRFVMNLSFVANTDEQGRFAIRGVPPGTYGLMALESFANEMTGSPRMAYPRDREPFYNASDRSAVRVQVTMPGQSVNLGTIVGR